MTTESTETTSPGTHAGNDYGEYAAPYFKNVSTRRMIAMVVVFAWLFVFAVGLLIPSETYRKKLGWDPTTKEAQNTALLQARVKALESQIAEFKAVKENGDENSQDDLKEKETEQVVTGVPDEIKKPDTTDEPLLLTDLVKKLESLQKSLDDFKQNPPQLPQEDNKPWAFLVASIAFTPLNIAFLCILAGCMGACCVSEATVKDVIMQLKSNEDPAIESDLKRRLNFLTEHPLYSALRGLIVYLLLSSGLFIFTGTQPLMGDTEQTLSLASYIRNAGIFSFLSYLAGHDPTVFTNLIRMANRQSAEKPR